jgi:aminopeptidase N
VLANIASETESWTLRNTLTQLIQVARQYVSPETRDATIARVGDALWELAETAAPGSDAQFQFVKFFANIPSTPDHVAKLSALLDGAVKLDGLEIDADLTWELLEGLVLLGAAGEAEIAAQLAKDNTANGQQSAARARATGDKAGALEQALTDASLSNIVLRSSGLGFQHSNDPSALQPLVDRYFGALEETWKTRPFTIAEYVAIWFYPSALVSQELVDATNAWLDTTSETPALRRLVVENLAGVERALRAQQRDRSS